MSLSKHNSIEAFILAAGFGKRLYPLTKKLPKPLIPFLGRAILFHTLDQLKSLKIEQININAHYMWQKIEEAIRKYPKKTKVELFIEKDQILGTAGALSVKKKMLADHLLVINGDIFHCFPLQDIIDLHIARSALATMALTQNVHKNETPIWVYENKVISIGKKTHPLSQARGFACIQVLSKKFLDNIVSNEPSCIIELYKKLLNEGHEIFAHVSNNLWFDLGTTERILAAETKIKSLLKEEKKVLHHPFFFKQATSTI